LGTAAYNRINSNLPLVLNQREIFDFILKAGQVYRIYSRGKTGEMIEGLPPIVFWFRLVIQNHFKARHHLVIELLDNL
jgi:hypothetical protein